MYFPSNMNFQYFFLPPIRGLSYSSFPVTHDPSVAERCDRIVQMADGRIGGDGKPTLCEKKKLAEISSAS